MSTNVFTGHALCQALKLEGFSDRAEANVEGRLRHLWENNGPDFVIDTLKVLKSDTEASLVDDTHRYTYTEGISVKWNHKESRPSGPLGCFYTKFPKPVERLRVIGAAINAITYEEATPKQMDKFVSNVRSNTRSNETIRFSNRFLKRFEDRLRHRIHQVNEPFGPQHLTNRSLPYGNLTVMVDEPKRQLGIASTVQALKTSEATHRAVLLLDSNVKGQFYTAPYGCKAGWNEVLDLAGVDEETKQLIRYPGKVQPRPLMARDYERSPKYGCLADDSAEYSCRGDADYLGRLDFLQKPGGKLRSVANVNRFVNYTMEPYALALEDMFYGYDEVRVLDQNQAMRDVCHQLKFNQVRKEPIELSSMDLSAATDTLDFRVFTRGLKRDFPGSTGLLKRYVEYFEKMSQLPLYCEPLEAAVQFKTGQPLGMKGSFQTLTAMNYLAGRMAAKTANLSHAFFRVVGDDFVCDSRIASQYGKIISSWGGTTNAEKCMTSYKYAEFLSHIMTADNVYITKPKYRPSSKAVFTNLEKSKKRDCLGIFRLNQQEKNAVEILSSYSVDPLDVRTNLPNLRSKNNEMDSYSLEVMSTALQYLAEWRGPESTLTHDLSDLTIEFMYLEDPSILKETHAPVINGKTIGKGPVRQSMTTFPTTDVVYNHHSGKHEKYKTNSQSYQSSLSVAKDMDKIHRSLTTSDNDVIDLGYGMKANTDDLVVSALESVDASSVEDRKKSSTLAQGSSKQKQRRLPKGSYELMASWTTSHRNDSEVQICPEALRRRNKSKTSPSKLSKSRRPASTSLVDEDNCPHPNDWDLER